MIKSKFKKNVLFSFGGQVVLIILGIIVPRIMIINYGSDINGLISTVSQIFAYMALLEAGIGQAAKNAIYKPIASNNRDEISAVVSVAQRYFRRITILYGFGVLSISFIAPLLLKTSVDYWTVFCVALFEGMSGVVSFYFIQTKTIVLSADGREYINTGVNVVNRTISYIAKIFLALLGKSIVLLQIVYFVITIIKSLYYQFYFKKNYNWINYKKSSKSAKLEDRNAYVISEIAWTIFSSTDMIVLSTMISTQMSSVYGVYNMVFANLNILLNAVYSSIVYVLGRTFHQDKKQYIVYHDLFTSVFMGCMTAMMCTAYILIIPFVRLYTAGVTDVNYIYPSLPILFSLVQLFSWSRYVPGNLIGIAGYAKKAVKINMLEALTNLILSVIFVMRLGIFGVLLATVLAIPVKVIYCIYMADHVILKRTCLQTVKILFINYAVFAVFVVIGNMIRISINNITEFVITGAICFLISIITVTVFNSIGNPNIIRFFKQAVGRKFKI